MKRTRIDGQVLEACRKGDRDAFRSLFEFYKDTIYSMALHFCGDDATAKDITQQVFLKLFTRMDQFRDEAEFTTWLYRIVANTCIDEQRSRRRLVPFDADGQISNMASKGSVEESYMRRQVSKSVQIAIGELKPKLRITMVLKYMQDLSYEEIASALNCSTGTVASRLNRGHKILARKLAHLRDAAASGE
jgi:RNA polymerase sigma-70 factor (ECF subfamily)